MDTPPEATPTDILDLSLLSEEELEAKRKAWRRDPVLWCIERLGIKCSLEPGYQEGDELDAHQKALLRELPRSIVTRKPIVVSSANAMGKDYSISGRASLWFYECFGPECKVVMTGPTERQVETIMWNELKSAYSRRPSQDELGRILSCYLDGGPDHFITAFTTKETEVAVGKFQGIHSSRLMIIVSEAQGVDKPIFEQIEGLTMAEILIVIYLGNPLTDTGEYARMIDDPINNTVIRLDAYDAANVKLGRQVLPGIVNKAWVDDKERRWNADKSGKDPRYMARVRGLKPTSGINAVISRDLYRACQGRRGNVSFYSGRVGTIGVDPALTGTDDMIIRVLVSGEWVDRIQIPYCEAPEAVSHIALMQKKHFEDGGCVIVIESDGLGLPIAQFYRRTMPTKLVHPIQLIEFHGSCSDRSIVNELYTNHRAEASFYAKERMMKGHIAMPIDEPDLEEEATGELYFTNPRTGRLQLEDKDDIRVRLTRSPNDWDAAKCAIWGLKFALPIKDRETWRPDGGRSSRSLMRGGGSAMAA